MAASPDPVLFVGCGRMGGALARALTDMHRVLAFDPNAELPPGVERLAALEPQVLPRRMTVVLAIKPQAFDAAAAQLAGLAGERHLFVSIMAGIPLDRLGAALGRQAAIVRAMPNTPAAIGCGITAAVASGRVDDGQHAQAARILEAAGEVVWLEHEAWLDAATAVSGSGPAYFFRFTEALTLAGIAEGLPPPVAASLARQTFVGAARLAEQDTAPLEELRRQVTSPGGTTAAGLEVMVSGPGIDALLREVVRAAAARSRELASPA